MNLTNRLFDCPHCKAKCQFAPLHNNYVKCTADNMYYTAWICNNCSGMILAIAQYSTSGNFDRFWPSFKRMPGIKTNNLPKDILYNYIESLITFSSDCHLSTAIMCRRCIQAVCNDKNANGDNLMKQIDNMTIDDSLKQLAQNIRFLGNRGAHPDILLGEEIEEDEASTVLDFVEKFLDFVYIIPADLKNLEDKIGKKQKDGESE